MKRFFILFLCLFTTDSVASGIASNTNSAPCTNNTLETYSGNSNLAADWQPNEIQLRWYNNNTLMNVQSSANTCVYDSTLTVPQTAPTRTGYTFAGWTVRPEMDFKTIPTNEDGVERWSKNTTNRCRYDTNTGSPATVACNSDNNFDELQQYEWKVKYSHGAVYGMAMCSTTTGSWAQTGNPNSESGIHCWCKVTGYKQTNSNVINAPTANLPWVFAYTDEHYCSGSCEAHCSYRAEFNPDHRRVMFGITQ